MLGDFKVVICVRTEATASQGCAASTETQRLQAIIRYNHYIRHKRCGAVQNTARDTRGRGPLQLVKAWPAVSQSAALKAEHAFKQLPRPAKDSKLKSRARQAPHLPPAARGGGGMKASRTIKSSRL
jgi:predicted GIY-YIG superfamily endonuclease